MVKTQTTLIIDQWPVISLKVLPSKQLAIWFLKGVISQAVTQNQSFTHADRKLKQSSANNNVPWHPQDHFRRQLLHLNFEQLYSLNGNMEEAMIRAYHWNWSYV